MLRLASALLVLLPYSPPAQAEPPPISSPPGLPAIVPAPQSMRATSISPSSGFSLADDFVTYVDGPEAAQALRDLRVDGPAGLPPGGYVLTIGETAGRKIIAIDGVDAAGTFYAQQTLRQLQQAKSVPGLVIRDFPAFGLRGGMESFYGTPWSQADLLRHLDWLGAHRMNAFQYTVSGDPHTSDVRWRDPYPAAELARFEEAIARARQNHVEFIYRINPESNVSPQHGICHASRSDLDKLVARYQQLYDVGERTFSIGWDDVNGRFVCDLDIQTFGTGPTALADAQTSVLKHVYSHFITQRPGAKLVTVPTEYWGTGSSPYRTRFAEQVPADVPIFWTGREVVSPTITAAELAQAEQAFGGRKLLIFDNYPVNDFAPTQQHLGPLVGRDPALAGSALGILANEMQEAEASLLSLYTVADYAWNPSAYDAQASWARSLQEFGGTAYPALRTYAEASTASPLHPESAPIAPLAKAFQQAWRTGGDLGPSGDALLAELAKVKVAPQQLRETLANPSFLRDSEGWFVALEGRATAAEHVVRGLRAKAAGDLATYRAERRAMGLALAQGNKFGRVVTPGVFDELTDLMAAPRGAPVIRHDSGAMSIFARGSNGRLRTAWQRTTGSNWEPFTDLAGITMHGQPEVLADRAGLMAAFVRGSDDRLWMARQNSAGTAWGAWSKISEGVVTDSPTVVQADDGGFSVFARGANGQLWTVWQLADGWSSLVPLPGITMLGKPEVVVGQNGVMTAVVRGSDNQVWVNKQRGPGTDWIGWIPLGGSTVDNPRLAATYDGGYSVFIRGTDGRLQTSWQTSYDGPWHAFVAIGGITMTGPPEVVVGNNGAIQAYVLGSDRRIWTAWQKHAGDNWSHWATVVEAFTGAGGAPAAVDSAAGAVSLFGLGLDGRVRTAWQTGAGSGWTGWADLGAP
ncbi:beta-N-acetylglucosaminidase domain-containing protein [Kribbella deserti]|uniref:Beta-N-acetylglucosaminidase domain-containing protein n=1 Tax=Kribbella deserti TaxID=1926257 RepID=A0ABV6QKP5_9ACTN